MDDKERSGDTLSQRGQAVVTAASGGAAVGWRNNTRPGFVLARASGRRHYAPALRGMRDSDHRRRPSHSVPRPLIAELGEGDR